MRRMYLRKIGAIAVSIMNRVGNVDAKIASITCTNVAPVSDVITMNARMKLSWKEGRRINDSSLSNQIDASA